MKPYSHAIYYPSSFNTMFHVYGNFDCAISIFEDREVHHGNTGYDDLMLHMDADGFIYRFNKKHDHDPLKLIENFKPVVRENI